MAELIELRDLSKQFKGNEFHPDRKHYVQALDHISLTIHEGEILGLVGGSGSGKSVLARILMQLLPPTSGQILYRGEDAGSFSPDRLKSVQDRMEIVFQQPHAALNPRMTMGDLIRAPLDGLRRGTPAEREARTGAMLKEVGLVPAVRILYPHDLPEEQLQQILLARALISEPELLVYDEPVSALESSNRPFIIKLVSELQKKYGFSMIFISHDLASTRRMSHRMAVMYRGSLMEICDAEELFRNPLHPHTKMLIPRDLGNENVQTNLPLFVKEEEGAYETPSGCPFHPACSFATIRCRSERPLLREIRPKHRAACHWAEPDGSIDTKSDEPLKE